MNTVNLRRSELKVEIGRRLKQKRQELGLSNAELARRAGMGWRNLYFIEAGRGVSVLGLLCVAEALGVSMDWLCGRGEEVTA